VLGIAGDTNGCLWLSTPNHVLRVYRDKLLKGKVSDEDLREFGLADGLRSVEGVRQDRSVAMDPLGRIWFATYKGLSVVDPKQVAGNSVPAIAHIEQVARDGNPVDLQGPIRIAGGRQRITFSYTGLSLSIPGRVRFRYKLDGYDKDWSEPSAARQAVYTNLDPSSYRFRVIASNSAGLWNGEESTIQFEIEPLFWQTWWFRLSSALAIGLTILFIYRFRLHQLTRQMNVRFEERLAERTRIAQDLHDTLLQGFLSASMQLHVADKQLPADSPGKPLVGRVLELMEQVIDEGRTTLQGLRSTGGSSYDLAQSFSGIQEELSSEERIDYRVTVEGSSRPLQPVIRDEIYHIGREALLNAFRHSRANTIEVELEYRLKQFRILVRDDGCGIDPQVISSGREGHWGLPGMRERAEEIGASIRVWSRQGAGTEVELSIPGQIAYELQSTQRLGSWLAKLYHRKPNHDGRK
jgi:signal transduction histidine kinase